MLDANSKSGAAMRASHKISPVNFKVYDQGISDDVIDNITKDIEIQPQPCKALVIFDDNSDMIHSQGRESKLKLLYRSR